MYICTTINPVSVHLNDGVVTSFTRAYITLAHTHTHPNLHQKSELLYSNPLLIVKKVLRSFKMNKERNYNSRAKCVLYSVTLSLFVGSLTFMSRINFKLSFISLRPVFFSKRQQFYFCYFYIYQQNINTKVESLKARKLLFSPLQRCITSGSGCVTQLLFLLVHLCYSVFCCIFPPLP